MKKVSAPCSTCVGKTTQNVLFEVARKGDKTDNPYHETDNTYALLSCGGCSTISMRLERHWLAEGLVDYKYYPSPVSRKKPDWLISLAEGFDTSRNDRKLSELFTEIYQAVDGGQHRLAAMGIRALLEQVMILKVGDLATFDRKLDEFQKQGYISLIQRDAMRATLDVGDAAMHRAFKPTEKDLKVALDVVEGVFSPIFGHMHEAERLADRVPPRAPRPTKK